MKRILVVISILAFVLVGCGKKGKPDDVPQEVYDALVPLVNTLDEYIKGDADLDDLQTASSKASDYIVAFYENSDAAPTSPEYRKGTALISDTSKLSLALSKSYLSIGTGSNDKDTIKEVKEILKSLKKNIGM